MKNFIQSFLFLAVFVPCKFHAQIEISKEKEIKNEQTVSDTTSKKKRSERKNVDGTTEIYLTSAWSSSTRVLETRSDAFAKPLGIKADETPIMIWSYGFGFRNYLHKHIVFEGGMSLLRNGEMYTLIGDDSSYKYVNTYTYIAMPLRLQYATSGDFKFFIGGSAFPQIMYLYKHKETWVDNNNQTTTTIDKDKSPYSSFVFSAGINAGFQAKFSKYTSFYFLPEYRWQLTNSYTKIGNYGHYARVLSVNFGLIYQL